MHCIFFFFYLLAFKIFSLSHVLRNWVWMCFIYFMFFVLEVMSFFDLFTANFTFIKTLASIFFKYFFPVTPSSQIPVPCTVKPLEYYWYSAYLLITFLMYYFEYFPLLFFKFTCIFFCMSNLLSVWRSMVFNLRHCSFNL